MELGLLVSTKRINDAMLENHDFLTEVNDCLTKYISGDWGNIGAEDKESNDAAVKSGEDMVLASYATSKGTIWILTEWNRSATTVLFPDEY